MRSSWVFVVALAGCGSNTSAGVDAAPTSDAVDVGADSPPPGVLPAGDTFEGSALDASWSILDPTDGDFAVTGGRLAIVPRPQALWFNERTGPFVFKLVTGDVKVTAPVHARRTSDPMQPPSQFVEVGGIMMRNPQSASENYVFLDVGFAEQGRIAVEHKSTVDGVSVFGETSSSPDADLRLCRTGTMIAAYRRDPGTTVWQLELAVDRADLPPVLQVGLDASTFQQAPDVTITFDEVTFEPVGDGCDR
jgi:hypothetical protein